MLINAKIDKTSAVRNKTRLYNVKMGRYSYVARNSLIQNTEIGSFCSISEGCNIGLPSHPLTFLSTSPVFLNGNNYLNYHFSYFTHNACPQTIIQNDVWIGAHAQIKSGVTIRNGAVVGAGAVVTNDVPPYAIVGGVPAKIIRFRFSESEIQILESLKWWDWSNEKLLGNANTFNDINEITRGVGI